MILELKRKNDKSILLDTTKKKINDSSIRKLIKIYLELKDDKIENYSDITIQNTIKHIGAYLIKWDSIEFVVKGNPKEDYIKLKNKYQSATLYNDDYVLYYE